MQYKKAIRNPLGARHKKHEDSRISIFKVLTTSIKKTVDKMFCLLGATCNIKTASMVFITAPASFNVVSN